MPFIVSCKHILSGHFDHHTVAEAIEFNGTILVRFTSGVILLLLIIKNKYRASREDGRRALLLVLPSYYPVICVAIAYYFTFAMLHLIIRGFNTYIVLMSLDVASSHAMTGGLLFFLMQHGAGVYAFQRSALFALGFGALAFFVFYFILSNSGDHTGDDDHLTQRTYLSHMIFSSLVMMFYAVTCFLPMKYLYRRPAFFQYAKYCIVECIVWVVASTLVYIENAAGYCTVLSGRIIFVGMLHPIFFVLCLAKDSEFWQGRNIPISDQSPVHEVWDLNLASACTIGTVLSDIQRHVKSLPVIHFSSIEFNMSNFISGGLSRVYFGKCKQKQIAIKVLFAIELTPKVVTDFYNEVQVMYQLRHENIVQCLGISVMPPTICVILEYCPHGSLYDLLHNHNKAPSESAKSHAADEATLSLENLGKVNAAFVKRQLSVERPVPTPATVSQFNEDAIELSGSLSLVNTPQRPVTLSNPAVRNPLNMASGNNSTHPDLVKPDNYDAESNRISSAREPRTLSLKLIRERFLERLPDTLFTLGASRPSMATTVSAFSDYRRESQKKGSGVPRSFTMLEKYKLLLGAGRGMAFLHSRGYIHCDIKSPNFLIAKDNVVKLADLGDARIIGQNYQALPFPAYNWAPPELLNTDVSKRFYSEASDVYGLAMVFAEILTQQLPLEEIFTNSSEAEIFHYLVVDNKRPELPAHLPEALTSIITRAWDSDATLRPSAAEIITVLESIYADELAEL